MLITDCKPRRKPIDSSVDINDGLPLARVRDVAEGIGRGLRDLHALEMVHGDVKPSNVMQDGDRVFLLARPHAGIDLRLARWVGILVEGGYELTSGDWTLKGERDLIDGLDFGDGNGPFAAVTLRFGI